MSRYVVIDSCPVPLGLAGAVTEARRHARFSLNSCYRGDDARPILNRYGKKSQAQLYYGWVHRLPGFNPANPPGVSTHELRSDGVAYPSIRRGARLPDEYCGMDASPSESLRTGLSRVGLSSRRPYPGGSEFHHVNLTERLAGRHAFRVPYNLRVGSRGPRVRGLTFRLQELAYLPVPLGAPVSTFSARHKAAVMRLQRAHRLTADGVYGDRTHKVALGARAARARAGTLKAHS